MFDLDPTAGVVGALALSAAAYVSVRTVRRSRGPSAAKDLSRSEVETLVAPLRAEIGPRRADPGTTASAARARVQVRRVTPVGRSRTPRPGTSDAARGALAGAEVLSLVNTMQWDRALQAVQRLDGAELARIAPMAEAIALERMRVLPDSEARMNFGGYRVLAVLRPADEGYAAKVAEYSEALRRRREALLGGLTLDEDRAEPGTIWLNHPWNPRFDDVRLPLWPYIGCRAGEAPRLRLRTNWLGDTRISVQGLDVIHDGMGERLTRGAYKIDADALGWEWRDEPADLYQIEVLRSLVSAREVRLRYQGDPFTIEVELGREERQAVADMIELYDILRIDAVAPRRAEAA